MFCEQDRRLAEHVMRVHMDGCPPPREGLDLFPPELLRAYVAHAKTYEPHVPFELTGATSAPQTSLHVRLLITSHPKPSPSDVQ